jgi:hypothetical protein
VTGRILLYAGLILLVSKLFFRVKFREIGARIDRAVTVMLVVIVLAYGAHVIWWLANGG